MAKVVGVTTATTAPLAADLKKDLLELFLFSCMFIHNKKVKRFAWYLGITFHLGIIFIHGLISFFFSMLGALTLYLITKKQKKL